MISKEQKPLNSGFGAKTEPKDILQGIDLTGKVAHGYGRLFRNRFRNY